MPTVIRIGQFRMYFWSREVSRIHIHVRHMALGIEACVWLDTLTIKRSSGSTRIDNAAIKLADRFSGEISLAWESHFQTWEK